MLGFSTFDVALGLVFVYLLLSLVCTAINEGLAAVLSLRGATLERCIRQLLGEDTSTAFYAHPLIQGLGRQGSFLRFFKQRPSYVSARTFALTVIDLIAPSRAKSPTFDEIRAAATTLPDHLKKPLLVLIDRAENDLHKLHDNVEGWFNEAMDRVAGVYKRRVQSLIFGLGLGVALFINADTIRMARALSTNATLRQAMVEQAKVFAASAGDSAARAKPDSAIRAIRTVVDSLGGLGLPIGWTLPDSVKTKPVPARIGYYLGDALPRFPGLLITAFAISLGAPFWFDLLNRFINIRAAGQPPEVKKPA